MALSKTLRRERTNATTRGTTSFSTSGNYKMPYGKTKYKVGGLSRGGNAGYGGNYAGSNSPYVVYQDTGTQYFIFYYNTPQTPANSYQTYGVPGDRYYSTQYTVTNGQVATQYSVTSPAPGWFQYGNSLPSPVSFRDTWTTNDFVRNYAGDTRYTAVYYSSGSPYYNPYYPGNVGASFEVGGVAFPGGAGGGSVTVPMTPATINYDPNGLTLALSEGARVDIENS